MQITVVSLLLVSALITAIVAAMGKCPLFVSVILLAIAALVQVIPKG